MRLIDDVLGFNPELTTQDNPNYKRFSLGLKIAAGGAALVLAGLAGDTIGIEGGSYVTAVGMVPFIGGGALAADEASVLKDTNQNY